MREQIRGEYADILALNPEAVSRLSASEFVALVGEHSTRKGEVETLEAGIYYINTAVAEWLDDLEKGQTFDGAEPTMSHLVDEQLTMLDDSSEFTDNITQQMVELRKTQLGGFKKIQETIKERITVQLEDKKRLLQDFLDSIRSGDVRKPVEQNQPHQEAA